MKRKILLASALLLAALLAFVALGWFPQAPLKRALEARLGQALGARVSIGALHVVPAGLRAEARDVEIESPTLRARIAELNVEAVREALDGKVVALRSLAIRGVVLEMQPARAQNAAPAGLEPPRVRIEHLEVRDATLRYSDPTLQGDVQLSGVSAQGALGTGALDLSVDSVRWERKTEPVSGSVRARIETTEDLTATLSRAELAAGASRIEASGMLGRLTAPAPDVRFQGEIDAGEVARLTDAGPARGRLRLSGRVLGAAPVTWEADASASSLAAFGIALDDLAAHAAGGASDASISSRFGLLGGRVTVEAERRGSAVGLHVEARELRPSDVRVSVQGEAKGRLAPDGDLQLSWNLDAEAEPGLRTLGDARLATATVQASGTVAGKGTPLLAGRATGTLGVVAGDGTERPSAFEAEFRTRGATAERITLSVPDTDLAGLVSELAGVADLHLEVAGPFQRLGGTARFEARDLVWRSIALGAFALDAEGRSGDWTISARLPEHALGMQAQSPFPGRGERRVSGTLDLGGTSLAALGSLLPAGAPRTGRLEGRVEFEGPFDRPTAFEARSDVTLRAEHYSLRAEGRFGAAPASPLDLRVTGTADLGAVERSESVEIAGKLEADLQIRGTRLAPQPVGRARVVGFSVAGKGLPEARLDEAEVELGSSSVELKPMVVQVADGSLTASGRYPLDAAAAAELHLEWSGLRAEKLLAALSPESEKSPLSARLSGKADFSGRGTDLAAWRGDTTLTAEAVTAADMALELTPLVVRLEHGLLAANPLTLTSGSGSLTIGGGFDLGRKTIDVRGQGNLDLRALSPVVGSASLTGVAQIDVTVAGPFDAPEPQGSILLTDAAVRLRDIPEALTKINGRIALKDGRLLLENVSAMLGGGDVTASGGARLKGAALEEARIDIQGRNLSLRYPVGLKSRLDADLALSGAQQGLVLRGDVRVARGLYDLDLALEGAVKAPVLQPEPSPMLRAIGLDVEVVLDNPVLIRNKLASVDVTGNLQFRGDLETPAPFGRLDLKSNGKVFVRGREFSLQDGGGLAYEGDWDPQVTISATRANIPDSTPGKSDEYDCTVSLSGRLATVQPNLTCEGLSQGEAFSLVTTGSTTGGTRGLGATVAGEQVASRALGQITQGLGFEEVAVQPELLARETDPGARFTFGKQLTRMLSLIYSVSLQGPEQRFTQIEARLPRGLSVKGQRTDDGDLAAGVGQRILLGRARKPPDEDRVRVSEVRFEGELPAEARGAARTKKGARVAAWDVQEDADRVRDALVERGYVEAEVSARLENEVAVLRVKSGPRFAWRVTGMDNPPDLADAFRKALYEEDAAERSRARLLETLRDRGYLRGRVTDVQAETQGDIRTLVFKVETGSLLSAEAHFPGADRIPERRLLAIAGGAGALLTDEQEALARMQDAYRREARFAARLGPVQVEETSGHARITVPVVEGDPPRISAITFEGVSLPEEGLLKASGLAVGSAYEETSVTAALEKLRTFYYARGYAQTGVNVENTLHGADVEVRIRVREGSPSVVGTVEIVGLRRMRESVVRRHVRIRPGDPVDPRLLSDVESRLLELGAFSSVLVTASPESPATIKVEIVEKDRIELAYDLRWSQDEQGSAQVDAEVRNLLGIGLDLGGRYRYGADNREARASAHLPSIFRGKFNVTAYDTQEDLEATDIFTGEPFINTQTERVLEFQQSVRVKRHTNVLGGYRFKSVFSTAFPFPIHIATLYSSGIREGRDHPLDARQGQFASLNLEFSPKALGSELTFVKGFGQFFLHRRLTPGWTWSQGYRVGLAKGFDGQNIIPSERFEAGGGDSLRGFAYNSVGPKDPFGEPAGGEAVLIFNQELRYRNRGKWGFAAFWDFGNVFEHVEDVDLDLRHDLGVGLRWVSPVGLLRFDLAFPLDRQPDEDRFQFIFSLGQVF